MTEQTLDKESDVMMIDDTEEDVRENKYLLFRIGKETYGIGIKNVTGIEEMQKITSVPDMPQFIKGVINLRGKIIPAMNLRIRFYMEEREYDDRTCIIIVNINDVSIGIIVDTVAEVIDIPEKDIQPPPDFKSETGREKYIKGLGKVGKEVKILLDVQKILFKEEIENINKRIKEKGDKK